MPCRPAPTARTVRSGNQPGLFLALCLALTLLPGCLKQACEDLADTTPALELGTGEEHFEAFADGASLPAAYGPQGGSHIWASLRTTGLFGGFTGPRSDTSHPSWDFDLEDDVGALGGTRGSGPFTNIGDGQTEIVGITVFLGLSMSGAPWLYDDPNPPADTPLDELLAMDQAAADTAMAKDLAFSATLTDACGRSASTARTVRLVGYEAANIDTSM